LATSAKVSVCARPVATPRGAEKGARGKGDVDVGVKCVCVAKADPGSNEHGVAA
jgi:hypothetical protein